MALFRFEGGNVYDEDSGEQVDQDSVDEFHVAFLGRFERVTPLDLAIVGGWDEQKRELIRRFGR